MSAVIQELDRLKAAANPAKDVVPFDRGRALQAARSLLSHAMQEREAPEYPIEALGPLADAARDIAREGQMQSALVGQSLLGAASLLTQGLYDVRTPAGVKPLSLYLLTKAESGEGKSTADGVAMAAVKEWQRQSSANYQAERERYDADMRSRKKDDNPPQEPRAPYRLVRDVTVEGLRRDLSTGPMSQGVFSDEAAALLGGYGMSAEHKSKTAATFSGLWDNGDLSVSRSTGGRVELYGRRLAMHWLLQPAAAEQALSDSLLSQLGFWPRFILAWPAPGEPRKDRPFRPDLQASVGAYWQRCRDLLAEPLVEEGAARPVIEFTDSARQMVGAVFEQLEREGRRGRLRCIKPFALRATEQICRVAGVLAAWSGRAVIEDEDARCAISLIRYSTATWRAVIEDGALNTGGATALRLYEWLTDPRYCPGWRCDARVILQRGPSALRSKTKRDEALELLEEAGLIERSGSTILALDPSDTTEGAL